MMVTEGSPVSKLLTVQMTVFGPMFELALIATAFRSAFTTVLLHKFAWAPTKTSPTTVAFGATYARQLISGFRSYRPRAFLWKSWLSYLLVPFSTQLTNCAHFSISFDGKISPKSSLRLLVPNTECQNILMAQPKVYDLGSHCKTRIFTRKMPSCHEMVPPDNTVASIKKNGYPVKIVSVGISIFLQSLYEEQIPASLFFFQVLCNLTIFHPKKIKK